MNTWKKICAVILSMSMSCGMVLADGEMIANATNQVVPVAEGRFGGHYYQVLDTSMTWKEAKVYCEKQGGHLATITSSEEQDFIETLIDQGNKKQYWLGASFETGTFRWVTGEAYEYSNWDEGEPNHEYRFGEEEAFVQIYNEPNPSIYVPDSQRYKWNDIFEDNIYPEEENFFDTCHVGILCEFEDKFIDVYDDWYTIYVEYVFDREIMTGIKGTPLFKPNGNVTKAQVAQVLYNLEGRPEVTDKKACVELYDVYNTWYTDAVCWAYNTGVVTGDLNTLRFYPDSDVTREQFALMLFRYTNYKGYPAEQTSDLTGLLNAENTGNWAIAGVKWAVGAGLISGIETSAGSDLAPKGTATRAQMAAMMMRFCKQYLQNKEL